MQRVVDSSRCFAYGSPADSLDEYCHLRESNTLLARKCFCNSVVNCFAARHFRLPTTEDLKSIESVFRDVGFPGCMGCIGCAGWAWAASPKALQGIMIGKEKKPAVRLVVCVT